MKMAAYAFAGALALTAVAIEQSPSVCQDHALLQIGGTRIARTGMHLNVANGQPCEEDCACWSAHAGSHTCGERITWVAGPQGPHSGDTEAAATIIFEEFPEVCRCAMPTREETTMSTTVEATMPATTSLMPTHAANEQPCEEDCACWSAHAGSHTCGERITWVAGPQGPHSGDTEAAATLIFEEFPEVCRCATPMREETTMSTTVEATMPATTSLMPTMSTTVESTVPATTSTKEQGELRSIEMTSYRQSGTDYPDSVSWPSSCSVKVVDDKVCASVQGYANEEDCGFTINEDGYISTVGGSGYASSGDYVRLLGTVYSPEGPQRVSVTAGTAMDFHSDSFFAGGSITLCFEPQRSIEMTSYKRWGSTYSPAMWPMMGSTCSVKEVDGMVCASVQGYADDEDCGFTINEAGYISTVGPRSFANTGDYVRLLGYAYNTSVPQSVSVTAGTSMDFHSDGEDAGGQITLCFEPEPSQ